MFLNKILFFITIFIFFQLIYSHKFDILGHLSKEPSYGPEGSFYRLNESFTGNVTAEEFVGDSKIVENFIFEIVFRLNSAAEKISLFRIDGGSDDKFFIKIALMHDHVVTFKVKTETLEIFRTYAPGGNINTRIYDGQWHKVVVAFLRGKSWLWFDCESVKGNENSIICPSSVDFSSGGNYEIQIHNDDKEIDVQSMTFRSGLNELVKLTCTDIPGYNKCTDYTGSHQEIDVLDLFDLNTSLASVHRFNNPLEKNLHIPSYFLAKDLKEIRFEIIFRYNSTEENIINLIEFKDRIHPRSLGFTFDPYGEIGFIEIDQKTGITTIKQNLNNKKMFDGDWHKVLFKLSNNKISYWIDCEELGSQTFNSTAPRIQFLSASQTVTLVKSASNKSIENFEISKLRLHTETDETNCDDMLIWNPYLLIPAK